MKDVGGRIQEIRQQLVADEDAPTGEKRAKLLDELHELEQKEQSDGEA